MIPNRAFLRALVCASLAAAAGCGGYNTVKVSGTVTLDGQPLAGATVTFIPLDEKAVHRIASGVTNDDGYFRLTTYNTNDGALPGEYRVTVTLVDMSKRYTLSDPDTSGMGHGARYMDSNRLKAPEFKGKVLAANRKNQRSLIPAVYGDPQRTTLRQIVPPHGEVKLELDGKAR